MHQIRPAVFNAYKLDLGRNLLLGRTLTILGKIRVVFPQFVIDFDLFGTQTAVIVIKGDRSHSCESKSSNIA